MMSLRRCVLTVLIATPHVCAQVASSGKGRYGGDEHEGPAKPGKGRQQGNELKHQPESQAQATELQKLDQTCPLAPRQSTYHPPERTVMASHPRAGSTWLRFLVERATGLPSGVEKAAWGNVLPHFGEFPDDGSGRAKPNRDGVIVKTHSACYGCWRGASTSDRLSLRRNTSLTKKYLDQHADKHFMTAMKKHGSCLLFPPATLEGQVRQHIGALGKGKGKGKSDEIVCTIVYDKAIVLHRDPMEMVKSNYHYRTSVLKMRQPNTWSKGDYEFPKERAESFVQFYWSWKRFAEAKPTLHLWYEDLKADPAKEIRKVVKFLELPVDDEKIACAVNASTMDKLKEDSSTMVNPNMGYDTDQFFGSRASTEAKEDLIYPEELLSHFERKGVFEVRQLLGYGTRADYVKSVGTSPKRPKSSKHEL